MLSDRLLSRVAQDPLGRRIPIADRTAWIHHEDGILGRIRNAAQPGLTFHERLLGALAQQSLSDVRRDSFEEFHRVEGETSFAPVVEVDQTDNPVLAPNGHQGDGGIAVMNALIAGMKPGIRGWRDVQQRE